MRQRSLRIGISLLALCIGGGTASAGTHACSATTSDAFDACRASTQDDKNTADGICRNLSDKASQKSCLSDARSAQQDAMGECKDQRSARADVCSALGEAPYAPAFDPADFDTDFAHLTHPNPLFPLAIGDQWTFSGGGEIDKVEITSATKLIQGVTCIVSHDVVTVDGIVTEDTNDWIAQAKSGSVFYCGEEAKQFETFPGDDPQTPELVSIDGSFKVGRNGDQTGVLMQATPAVGMTYRQECWGTRRTSARSSPPPIRSARTRTSTRTCRSPSPSCSARATAWSRATSHRSSRAPTSASTSRPGSATSWRSSSTPARSASSSAATSTRGAPCYPLPERDAPGVAWAI